jgi:hypothetical protein
MDIEHMSFGLCLDRLRDRIRLHMEAGQLVLDPRHRKSVSGDMLVAAFLNRSMGLVRGFCSLIGDNYICAAPLVRLQLDNLLRLSTIWLVDDLDKLTAHVADGKQIDKLKDRHGKRMRDSYLAQRMDEKVAGVAEVYKSACGYVHFSDAHLYHTIVVTGDRSVRIEIGDDAGVDEAIRKEAVLVMDQMTRIFLGGVKQYLLECGRLEE